VSIGLANGVDYVRGFLARRIWYAYLVRVLLCWAGIIFVSQILNILLFAVMRLDDPVSPFRNAALLQSAILAGAVVNIVAVYVFVRWFFRHVDQRPVSELRMDLTARTPALLVGGLVCAAAMLGLVFAVQDLAGWIEITEINWPPTSALMTAGASSLIQFISVGFLEEVRYRGYGYASGEGSVPRPLLILVTALAFAFLHAQYGAFGPLAVVSLACIAAFYVASLHLFGSLWFGVGFHCMWDFAQVSLFGLAFASQEEGASLIDINQNGPPLWVGGEALIEAGLVYLVLFALVAISIFAGLARHRGDAAA
jgi:hypothetical protein